MAHETEKDGKLFESDFLKYDVSEIDTLLNIKTTLLKTEEIKKPGNRLTEESII
jgi:hypothetical protein